MFAVSAAGVEERGTLCFVAKDMAPKCAAVEGTKMTIAAADADRSFVWTSADGKRVVAGIAPAKTDSVTLAGDDYRDVTLALSGDRQRGWPADVKVTLADRSKRQWEWTVPRKQVSTLATIAVPKGRYLFMFSADHHAPSVREATVEKDTSLRAVNLIAAPVIAAKIVNPKNEPILGATMSAGKRVLATSDEQGNARAEITEFIPIDTMTIEKPGYGARVVQVTMVQGEANLGTIQLSTGRTLKLQIDRPDSMPVTVRVVRKNDFKYEHTPVASRSLAVDEKTLELSDVGAATYYVEVAGKEPLEKMVAEVVVKDDDVEKTIKVEPFRLEGTVRVGDDPVAGKISISEHSHTIRAEVPVDASGHFSGSMWQHGKVTAFVQGGPIQPGEPVESPELGADPSTWTISFPKRFIAGRVVDGDTKEPVANASIDFFRSSAGRQFYSSVKADGEGRFSVAAPTAGTYELRVKRPEYAPGKLVVEIAEKDPGVQRDIVLWRGFAVPITAVNSLGLPIASATVVEGVLSDGHNPEYLYKTDETGTLNLRVVPGQHRTLFILPREGSFGIARVVAPNSSEDVRLVSVVVPPPAGTLRVILPPLKERRTIVLRFNGEEVPGSVWQRLPPAGFKGGLVINRLPAGTYEIVVERVGSKTVGISEGIVEVDLTAK
jgi:hypothetical protein